MTEKTYHCDCCNKLMTKKEYNELDGMCIPCIKEQFNPYMIYDTKTGGYKDIRVRE